MICVLNHQFYVILISYPLHLQRKHLMPNLWDVDFKNSGFVVFNTFHS